MARSPGFGSTEVYSRPLQTRFRCGSVLSDLTSHLSVTRRFILQKARHHPLTALTSCRHTVSGSLSLRSRGSFHLSLTVLVRYRSLPGYLALADGPACFRQDSSCLAVLRIPLGFTRISVTGLAPSSVTLSIVFSYPRSCRVAVLQPRSKDRFGLLPFRSPLLRESLLFSFPPGT